MTLEWQISVTECLDKGSRAYMEDFVCNHLEKVDEKIIFGVFGIFDGHGGCGAANYVKNTIVEELKRNSKFWSMDDSMVLLSIKEVYSRIQNILWAEREKWPQSIVGYKSTAGTTATIAIIRNNTIYVGHVGDSALVLASQNQSCLKGQFVTKEHKPTDSEEMCRIENCGGSLKAKSGITRIVWNRKNHSSKTKIDRIPFLAVARSLGDLWSYDSRFKSYHVSPEPDVTVIKLDSEKHRAIVLASDGIWNVMDAETSVNLLNVSYNLDKFSGITSINPAEMIVNYSLHLWNKKNLRSDNVSAIVVRLIPAGCQEDIKIDDNVALTSLQDEVLTNHISGKYDINQKVEKLENIDNFMEYIPRNTRSMNPSLEETEMLKRFLLASKKLAAHCIAWRDDLMYWERFKMSIGQLGVSGVANVVTFCDDDVVYFESLLRSFSWSIICQKNLTRSTLSPIEINRIRSQPLLTEFWTAFYKKIISPNLCFTLDQMTETSVYDMIMDHILLHKQSAIRAFVDDRLGTVYSLKRCQTYSTGTSILDRHLSDSTRCSSSSSTSQYITSSVKLNNIIAHIKLKRSSSFEISQLTISPQRAPSSLTSMLNSSSSTPIMSPSHMDLSTSSPVFHRPTILKRRSFVPLAVKVNLTRNISRLSLAAHKRSNTMAETQLVRYVARKKRKST